jgi:hypothetical protein
MTFESDKNDRRVSEIYRELASEKTSRKLDDKILEMAGSNARTRYGLVRSWIRPAAWAATIGLSLAFILEMSQYLDAPMQTPVSFDDAADDLMIHDEAAADNEGRARQEASKPANAPAPASMKLAPSEALSAVATETETTSPRKKLEDDNGTLLHEAADPLHHDANRAARAEASAELKEQMQHCDDAVRAAAESWFECIDDLRENGLAEAAGQELEALIAAFPEFREPNLNR